MTCLPGRTALISISENNYKLEEKISSPKLIASLQTFSVRRVVTRSSPRRWGGTRDKPNNVCVGGYAEVRHTILYIRIIFLIGSCYLTTIVLTNTIAYVV